MRYLTQHQHRSRRSSSSGTSRATAVPVAATGSGRTAAAEVAAEVTRMPAHGSAAGAQAKLAGPQSDDELEQEAERAAESIMRGGQPVLRTCPCGGGCPRCRAVAMGQDHSHGLPPPREQGQSALPHLDSGQPLDPSERTLMSSSFDRDFSAVRVHTDVRAAEAARAVNAVAYTVGRDVVFGAGQYAPGTAGGRRLLAHELTHVVQQQSTGRARLARQPAPRPTQVFQTDVAVTDRAVIEQWSKISFWLRRIGSLYQPVFTTETAQRFKDEEERDAVLAALWRVRPDPARLRTSQTHFVQIPAAARRRKQVAELLYKFVFVPKAATDPMPKVEIYFEAEQPNGVLAHAPSPPDDFDPESGLGTDIGGKTTQLHYSHQGFPQGDVLQYWEQHPDEYKQLFYWVQRQGRSFSQIVITRSVVRKGQTNAVRETHFRAQGTKDDRGKVTSLSIERLEAPFNLTQTWLPKDYHSHDAADALLLEIQEQADPTNHDRLGKVTLGTVPQDEAFVLKFTIWSYFKMGTRNAEVDAIVVTVPTKRRVMYTLRYRQNNDVDVERIGEEGTDARLDPHRLDIARASGFESNSDDPRKLKTWLRKRYPAIRAAGNDVHELREDVNKALSAQAHTADWFRLNYRIRILAPREGETRLRQMRQRPPQLVDLKTFTADELRLLELSVQPVSDKILSVLKETRFVRQKTRILAKPDGTFAPRPDVQGDTVIVGRDTTIIICDAAMSGSLRFTGGASGVLPGGTMTLTHELGHVVGWKTGALARFNAFVRAAGIKPFTPYAARQPDTEFFAEAFYLYHTDPQWLQSSHRQVFEWLDTLSRTGRPPANRP